MEVKHLDQFIESQRLVLKKGQVNEKLSDLRLRISEKNPGDRVRVINDITRSGQVVTGVEWNIRTTDWQKGTYLSKAVLVTADASDLLVQGGKGSTLVTEDNWDKELSNCLEEASEAPLDRTWSHDDIGKWVQGKI